MKKSLTEVVRGFWLSRRPLSWDEEMHRKNPLVNLTTNAEMALVRAYLESELNA